MNENLNLVEILKDAPKGTKLWSPICGECEFVGISKDVFPYYPIKCQTENYQGGTVCLWFTAEGEYDDNYANRECVLFPSKGNRDWSTFKVPKKHKHFEPFQKVLVKIWHDNKSIWIADFYSHYDGAACKHFLVSGLIREYDDIIPYEGNEDMLGKEVKQQIK